MRTRTRMAFIEDDKLAGRGAAVALAWELENISHGSLEGRFLGFWGRTTASSNKRSGIRGTDDHPLCPELDGG
ncbi:hypothetical protein TIFTF001_006737 [Ficus carica]|uniref:Uncharacterized protein n=1 Tax=Ficus carica TaxID=3494 RepID=A0AA87ZJL9_FICCA|nr:hypothetical protein TIFTF001_006737 [Ficus carica]